MVLEEEFINLSPESSFIGDISINPLMLTNMLLNSNIYINKEFVNNLADLYIKWGRSFNIRPDFAWSQMCLETNFLKFTNIAKLEWNNFCNLGVIKKKGLKGGYDYLTFKTLKLGVIAHYAHLAWYYFQSMLMSIVH